MLDIQYFVVFALYPSNVFGAVSSFNFRPHIVEDHSMVDSYTISSSIRNILMSKLFGLCKSTWCGMSVLIGAS